MRSFVRHDGDTVGLAGTTNRAIYSEALSQERAVTAGSLEDLRKIKRQSFSLGLGVFAAGLASCTMSRPMAYCAPSTTIEAPPGKADTAVAPSEKRTERIIVFVLGGPGSGKGTQCAKLVEEFGLVHLSAGDLLRAHMKSGTEDGNMVADMIKQGTIVPSHVTISLLEKAMNESEKQRFLIDGFPRNEENRSQFEKQTGEEPFFILFFDCPEETMEKRLLGRNQGRTDDNVESIKKRFKVFLDSSMPVVDHYDKSGKVYKFKSDRSPEGIYSEVRQLFLDL